MRSISTLLALAAACATDGTARPPAPPAPTPTPTTPTPGAPLFTDHEPAPDGSLLRVFVEPGQLVGWIAGGKSFAGETATIELAGATRTATVASDNTFALPYQVAKATEARVRVGSLVQTVTVEPAVRLEPTAYFVVDRPAYRPGQKLAFTAFLRRLDGDTAHPIANARVEVQIASQTKQTSAAKLALVADVHGRIHGEYTFGSGDPLDLYTIAIPGYRGSARVTLGEYRKSKVKLDVDAAIRSRSALLRFQALDFLEAPVPGGHVAFTAQIVRDPERSRPPSPLDPSRFAFASALGAITPDERLWLVAHPETAAWSRGAGAEVIEQIEGKVTLDGQGAGSHAIPIKSELVRGRHRLLVDAVIVDANGREQRTTRSISLARDDVRVELASADPLVATGHPIDVTVAVRDAEGRTVKPTSATIAALRVERPPARSVQHGYLGGWNGGFDDSWHIPACHYTARGCWHLPQQQVRPPDAPIETLAANVAVRGDTARVVLDDPGAYRLIASVQLADGTTAWSELGIAVREREALPPLVLELDRDEVGQGERITGRLQSRHSDATVLVVVRDTRGMRSRHRVVMARGEARIDLPAGDRLGYGAVVEAHALVASDGASMVYTAQAPLRVAPARQQLAIQTRVKPTYSPGETVDLDIAVDAREAVDLVVTVFDQSLLGVAPDHAVDPSSFYLADDRVRTPAALSSVRAQLGDVTVGEIVERARGLATRPIADTDDHDVDARAKREQASALVAMFDRPAALDLRAVTALLRHAGLRVAAPLHASWRMKVEQPRTLRARRIVDLIARDLAALAIERIGDAIVIVDPAQPAGQVGHASHNSYSRGDASGNASFSVSGQAAYSAPALIDVGGDATGVVRRDFSDSALWRANARTDASGKARISFVLPDSLTTWRVVVTAIGRDLRVGQHVTKLRSMRDVMIWPMLPRQFTEGDVVSIFSTVHNLTDADRDIAVQLDAKAVDVLSPRAVTVRVPRGKSVPVTWSVRAREPGLATLVMSARAPTGADASEKRIPIVASAADQLVTASGFADKPLVVALPAGIDPRRATLEISFAPSLAADMVDTLHYLVDYEYGCAEQTMSRFAPAIRVAGILDNLNVKHGPLRARLPGVVDASLKRLVELQQPDGGWGWHGSGATHEMITPYVVWGLIEAARTGYRIPGERVIERGLERIRTFIGALSGDEYLADRAYLMFVYAQRHPLPERWWTELVQKRERLSDYALALALEIAVMRQDRVNARGFVSALRTRAVRGGAGVHWRTAGFSRWSDDPFEISAAALKALVAYDANDPLVAESLAHFVATKRGDRWNSTKDTAMILYAMTDLLAKQGIGRVGGGAFVDYSIDGAAPVHLAFSGGLAKQVVIEGNRLGARTTIAFAKASPGMMARAVLRFRKSGRQLAPASHGLDVTRELFLVDSKGARLRPLASGARVPQGAYVESAVTVTHPQQQAMRFLLIEDPKPAGAEALPLDDPRFPRVATPWVLREDRETHVAFHHEQVGASTTTRTFLHLEMKGELVVPPAQAELMYQTATRGHAGSVILHVD